MLAAAAVWELAGAHGERIGRGGRLALALLSDGRVSSVGEAALRLGIPARLRARGTERAGADFGGAWRKARRSRCGRIAGERGGSRGTGPSRHSRRSGTTGRRLHGAGCAARARSAPATPALGGRFARDARPTLGRRRRWSRARARCWPRSPGSRSAHWRESWGSSPPRSRRARRSPRPSKAFASGCRATSWAPSAALERSRRYGSPLAEQLREQAASLRSEARRSTEERAARAAPKIQLVVALVLVPSVLLMIAAGLIANSDALLAGF